MKEYLSVTNFIHQTYKFGVVKKRCPCYLWSSEKDTLCLSVKADNLMGHLNGNR